MANNIKETKIQSVKLAPPPPGLPVYGRFPVSEVAFIGRTNYVAALEEKKFIFGIKRSDRLRHVYAVGKSGVGKSKLLEVMVRQDIAAGEGVFFLDHHGELISSILDFIPEERIDDVIIIDPVSGAGPIDWNPMADVPPAARYQFAQSLTEIMAVQFGDHWNLRLEHLCRMLAIALMDVPEANLNGLLLMLTDAEFRSRATARVTDESARHFWTAEFGLWNDRFETEAVLPLTNKLIQLVRHPALAQTFRSAGGKFRLQEAIDGRKIILVNLARERLGEANADFLGALLIAKLKEVGMMHRGKTATSHVYLDEFNHLVTPTLQNLLGEAGRFGFALTLAHQYIGQIPGDFISAILANVGTVIVFRVSGEDAAKLESEMDPVFKARDMINLGTRQFYIRMIIDGETYDPFSAEVLKVLPPPHPSFKERILEKMRANCVL
ncbi:type IV secretion system DNA-binding domain-containing protein [Patescibacteria group bacterium]|nr:type IV secretion system DNA-binding domain-containing protein [Patescibacteria group bacterium]